MRDRDVRNAIRDALLATSAFDAVWIWGLPEDYGSAASQLKAAAIEPVSSDQSDRWDAQPAGGLIVTSKVAITFLARDDDPQARDETAELLFDTAANTLNGENFAEYNGNVAMTMPGWTRFLSWRWEKPVAPERRIAATFSYAYIVEGWDNYDTTP